MRAVTQRVTSASVRVDEEVVGEIGRGLLVYLGAARGDGDADLHYMVDKVAGLRIFESEEGKMSLSVSDIGGSILVVSQFTLLGDVRRGRRPSFTEAAAPDDANDLYQRFVSSLRARDLEVATGRFRATMHVTADVWGPVTILLDSRKEF